MIIAREPNVYSFTGNSIVFELLVDTPDRIQVEIVTHEQSQYTSYYPFLENGQYKIKFDISDYLTAEKRDLYFSEEEIISPLYNFTLSYQVKIGSDYSFEGVAFKGGITKSDFKTLADNGFDIFSYRLGSYFNQFLFTTRTHSNEIRVRETELHPFVFINPGLDFVFKSESENTLTVTPDTSEKVCVLNFQAVREKFQELYNEIPKQIEVLVAGEVSFKIIIEPGAISEEKYLVRFLNSLGAYECIEVVGRLIHTPEFGDENKHSVLNEYDFFEDRRNRVSSRKTMKVETGYKHRRELPFVLDMIKSDEIYFIYPSGSSFRCNVIAEDPKFYHRMTVPTSISLIISEIVDEEFMSPELDNELLLSGSSIFDETFDGTFE